MEIFNKSQEIKRALLQGGLVVADRGTGKTRALSEILVEDPDAVVVVHNTAQKQQLEDYLFIKGYEMREANDKIILSLIAEKYLMGKNNKNIYVDEYALNSYKGPFKAAVTSFPFAVKVIK